MRARHHPSSSVPVTRSLTRERSVLLLPYLTSEQAETQKSEAMHLRSHGYKAELEFESCEFRVCTFLPLMLKGGAANQVSFRRLR